MKYDISIDKALFNVYSEIRLGLLRFRTDVHGPDEQFWSFMNVEVLPQDVGVRPYYRIVVL